MFDLPPPHPRWAHNPGPSRLLVNLPDVCQRWSCCVERFEDGDGILVFWHLNLIRRDKLWIYLPDYAEHGYTDLLYAWTVTCHRLSGAYY